MEYKYQYEYKAEDGTIISGSAQKIATYLAYKSSYLTSAKIRDCLRDYYSATLDRYGYFPALYQAVKGKRFQKAFGIIYALARVK